MGLTFSPRSVVLRQECESSLLVLEDSMLFAVSETTVRTQLELLDRY